jgi:EpsI family protein
MVLGAAAAWWLTPRLEAANGLPTLAEAIPTTFGEWKEIHTTAAPVDPAGEAREGTDAHQLYDEVLLRTYANSRGETVLLALAYGKNQRQELKVHRPELCYIAQGFRVLRHVPTAFAIPVGAGTPVTGVRMLVEAPGRVEAVSYWIRIGRTYSENAWRTRYHIFHEGLKGHILDGILVRASQIVPGSEDANPKSYELQEQFLADLIRSLSPQAGHLLLG